MDRGREEKMRGLMCRPAQDRLDSKYNLFEYLHSYMAL